ncbi:MAG: hypothetical protein IH984_12235 [Planctomycetes bacterium]|nr:hypothetical protein [Planctomycetota bacterium]
MPAAAADERDQIPNQIVVRQFEIYLDSCEPTRAQFIESVSLFKTYLDDYNHLRATKIEKQLADRVTADDLAGMVKQFKSLIRKQKLLRRKVTRLDSALFDSLQALMSQQQLEYLQRARSHRIRQTAPISDFFKSTGRKFIDLSNVSSRIIELNDKDRELLDTVIKTYEQRLTAIVRQLAKDVPDIQGDVLAGLLEQNYELDTEGFGLAYDELRNALTEPSLKLTQTVDELNSRTSRSIEALLTNSGVDAWRLASVKAMYPHAQFIIRAELHAKKVRQQLVDFTDDDRVLLDYQLTETINQLRITLKTLITADNTNNKRHSPYVPGLGAAMQTYYQARSDARQRVSELLKVQKELFKTQLSEAGFILWTKTSASVLRSTQPGNSRESEVKSTGYASTSFAPIFQKDLNHYKLLLSLNEMQFNAIKPVYAMYLPRARAVVSKSHNGVDPQKHKFNWLPSESSVRKLTELDTDIFALLNTFTNTESDQACLKSLQAIRRRKLLTHKINLSGAGEIDFTNVLYHTGLPNDALFTLDDLLTEYNPRADILFTARFQAYKKIIDLQTMEDNESDLNEARDNRRGIQQQLARLNLDTVKQALDLLAQDDRDALEKAFDKAAFGRVLRDSSVADRLIQQATQLRDLNQLQSESIKTVKEEYKNSYRKFTRRIVETVGDNVSWSVDENQELWPFGSNKQRATLQRLRFERQQLNELVRLTLRTILSNDQFKLISRYAK